MGIGMRELLVILVVCLVVFGANMQVSLVNDGPVTFWLETAPATS